MYVEYVADLEWINKHTGIIRGGPNYEYGDAYSFVAFIFNLNNQWFIKGFHGEYNLAIRRAINTLLNDNGIARVKYERLNMKKKRRKSILIKDK